MRGVRLNAVLISFVGAAILAAAGASRPPGLWEMTTTTTWQKAPSVQGQNSDFLKGGTTTTQLCLTEEMIDQYGALLPQSHGQCSIENKVLTPGKLTAQYVCSGTMTGSGPLESVWSDMEHEKGTVHFTGTLRLGTAVQSVEWTTVSTSHFKSSDCGIVKPVTLPKREH
jgi:hypothetical protein